MKKLTTEEYINKAKEKHGDLYDYTKTKYINSTTKVTITCPIHGDWETNARNHISATAGKCGCPKCSGRGLSSEEWVEKFNKVHNSKFNYSKFVYTSIYEKSIIICNTHGEFKQTPHNHSQGQQCPKCSRKEAWLHNSYYNMTNAQKNKTEWLSILCNLYIIKMTSQDEVFYKIGITNQDISKRFREHDTPYKVTLVKLIESNRFDAIMLENKLHDLHKEYKYEPKKFFKGHTECFKEFKGVLND